MARASAADSTALRVSARTSWASSKRPAVTRLWKRHARWRARSTAGSSGRLSASRPAPILISGEIANMPAMLRRTSASWTAGSVSRSARSANSIACSLLPAMCRAIAVVLTISPRRGSCGGAISSARRPNTAAVSGSVVIRAFAASSRVAIATSSPGSALAPSCAADLHRQSAPLRVGRLQPDGRALAGPCRARSPGRLRG